MRIRIDGEMGTGSSRMWNVTSREGAARGVIPESEVRTGAELSGWSFSTTTAYHFRQLFPRPVLS